MPNTSPLCASNAAVSNGRGTRLACLSDRRGGRTGGNPHLLPRVRGKGVFLAKPGRLVSRHRRSADSGSREDLMIQVEPGTWRLGRSRLDSPSSFSALASRFLRPRIQMTLRRLLPRLVPSRSSRSASRLPGRTRQAPKRKDRRGRVPPAAKWGPAPQTNLYHPRTSASKVCQSMSPTRCGNAPGTCDRTLFESGPLPVAARA
jgi:hypothetical protein